MAPLPVSVIIPACNAAATLPATLDSLRQQTSPHWEAIVVENGSTDTTAAVAAEYCARDPRIRLHVMAGQGVSLARNAGLELAHHEWVLFLDADDWIAPSHLERMTGVLAADAALDAVHCGWARVTDETGTLGANQYGTHINAGGAIVVEFLLTFLFVLVVLLVYNRTEQASIRGVAISEP